MGLDKIITNEERQKSANLPPSLIMLMFNVLL